MSNIISPCASTLKAFGNFTSQKIAVNNAPEFDEEFIECFAYTRFKIHWISAAIVAEVEND